MPDEVEFVPLLTQTRWSNELNELTTDELVKLLPKELQLEVRRANWAYEHINELANKVVVNPRTNEAINNTRVSKEEIMLLFDSEKIELDELTQEENTLAYIASDPVLWCRFALGINPRIYQILILRDLHTRLILRLGRRCLTGNTPVLMDDGTWKRIDEIKAGDIVSARHTTNNKLVPRTVIDQWSTGEQEVYKITLSNGREIEATSNHQFLTKVQSGNRNCAKKEWKSIDEGLSVGMKLHLMNEYNAGNTNFRLVTIRSIVPAGLRQTYDITVDTDHSFIANGIVTHNCGKTASFAMRILYRAINRPGNIALVITPMKSHADVLWNMLKELMRGNPELAEQLRTRKIHATEQPHYEMEFPNGSVVKMFTSGVKSKNNADNVRGQEADDIYLDEVDLMSSDDLPAFTSILRGTGRGEKTMCIASTPNGRRDMLYRFCTEFTDRKKIDRIYKEYYFPTHADMNYTRADDAEQKMLLTAAQYNHEIIADFGEEVTGVFLKSHIERAMNHYPSGYDYLPLEAIYQNASPTTKLVLGVDWDKYGAGVNIVMCKIDYEEKSNRDPELGRVKPVARWEVPRGMETLTQAVDLVKTLNGRFNPDAIYIDRGFGEMQYEELMLSSQRNTNDDPRVVGLDKKLRGIHFAQNVEVIDPVTNAIMEKPVKDYMVTLTIKLFEEDRIILNATDYDQVAGGSDMVKQFEMYQYHRTPLGRPVYEPGSTAVGDHALDAFMLCVLAMYQEWGSFTQKPSTGKPKSVKFNVMDVMGSESYSPKDSTDGRPPKFRIQRSNIKAGRRQSGRTVKRSGI